MNYLSPALLFGNDYTLPLDSKTLQRERKRLMADLELSGGDAIALSGRSFTRNELIGYFEELQQENTAAWHQAIAADPVLLRFLQDTKIRSGDRFKEPQLYTEPTFIQWISPYFRAAFTTFVTNSFEQGDARGMHALLNNRLLLTHEDQEQCWLFISGILEKNIALFEHYKGHSQKTDPPMMPVTEISAYIGHLYIEVIRQLPNDRFARLKDRYAFTMNYPAVAVFNRDERNRSLTIIWLEEAWNLAISESVRAKIRVKGNELNNMMHAPAKKSNIWRYVWIILIVIRILFYFMHG